MLNHISGSGANVYSECQRRFYYKYIIKVPFFDEPNEHLKFGSIIDEYIGNKVLEKEDNTDLNRLTDSGYIVFFQQFVSQSKVFIDNIKKDGEISTQENFNIDFDYLKLLGYLDIMTAKRIIEVKTKSGKRTTSTIKKSWQFRIYNWLAKKLGKEFWILQFDKTKQRTFFNNIGRDDKNFEIELQEIIDNCKSLEIKDYPVNSKGCMFCEFKNICHG